MKNKTFTKKDEFGRNYLDGTSGKLSSDILGRFYGEAVDRLAEFEKVDSGEKKRKSCEGCYHNEVCQALEELNGIPRISALSCGYHKDNSRFIELPCKVGDKVYRLTTLTDVGKCIGCEYYFSGGMGDGPECEKTRIGDRPPECIEIEEIIVTMRDIYFWLYIDDFNKNVFFTREGAEKALEERKKK